MFDVFSIVAVGVAIAGFTHLVFRLFARKPPRFLMPLAAGLGMMAFTIWNDYDWPRRMIEILPDGHGVVEEVEQSTAWRPWTLMVPRVTRIVTVNTKNRLQPKPGIFILESVHYDRSDPRFLTYHAFDCKLARRVDLAADANLTAEGLPADGGWYRADPDDTMFRVACIRS